MTETQTTPTNETNELLQKYETQTCGRCLGSGQYSYCQMYGTRCFGCGGRGKVYSKRGQAAIAFGKALTMMKAKDVQVGMLMFHDGIGPFGGKRGWFTVTHSALSDGCYSTAQDGTRTYYWLVRTGTGDDCRGLNTSPDSDVQVVADKARLVEVKRLALEYQATLLKTGKQSKRLARAAQGGR